MQARKWWQKPVSIMGHLYVGSKLPKGNINIAKFKKKLGFDAEHLLGSELCMGGKEGGDDGKSYIYKTKVGYIKDDLKDYSKAARKTNLKVIVYFNVHWFNSGLEDKNFARDSAGTKLTAYGSGFLTCVNGPFLKFATQVAEDLGKYDIAGVFLDGPLYRLCYCEYCQKQFKDKYGIRIPSDLSKASKEARKWAEDFTVEGYNRFLRLFKSTFNRGNPEGVVYHNAATYGNPGYVNEAAAKVVDILGVEGGFIGYTPLKPQFFFKTGATAKLAEYWADGKPVVIYIDVGFKNFDFYSLTEAEIYRMYAETIANNANPWFLVYPNETTRGMSAGVKMNYFIKNNREALTGSRSLAKTAIMYSGLNIKLCAENKDAEDDVHSTIKLGSSDMVGNHMEAFNGMYSALIRSQLNFDVIGETYLKKNLKKYELLILPSVMAMSEESVEIIRQFVKNGGNVLATFDTSLYDEEGKCRKDYALSDVFGVSAGAMPKPTTLDYINLKDNRVFSAGVDQKRIPCPKYCRYVELKGKSGVTVLANYYERMPRRYALLTQVSKKPAAVLNDYGKGKVVFIPNEIDRYFSQFSFPEERQFLANAVKALSSSLVELDKGLNLIEVVLRQNEKGEKLLHLMNLTGAERPVENITPFENISVLLKTKEKAIKVYAAFSKKKLKFKKVKDGVKFVLPVLNHYEMVIVKTAKES